jgi:hypothetical protein
MPHTLLADVALVDPQRDDQHDHDGGDEQPAVRHR